MKKFRLTENYDIWQNNNAYPKGTILHEYTKCVYGCIDWESETPCTLEPGEEPFIGIPNDMLEEIKE